MAEYPANGEIVAVHWLKGVAGINPDLVNTTLPQPNDSFAASGFVQATQVAGTEDIYTFMQESVIQVDCWAYTANSNKPPWGKAMTLAERIKRDAETGARLVVTPSQFEDALVRQVTCSTLPRRFPDPAYARYMMDLRIYWTRKEGT